MDGGYARLHAGMPDVELEESIKGDQAGQDARQEDEIAGGELRVVGSYCASLRSRRLHSRVLWRLTRPPSGWACTLYDQCTPSLWSRNLTARGENPCSMSELAI